MRKNKQITKSFGLYSEAEALMRNALANQLTDYVSANGHKPTDTTAPYCKNYDVELEVEVSATIGHGLLAFDVVKLILAEDNDLYLLRYNDSDLETVKSFDIETMYDLYCQLCDQEKEEEEEPRLTNVWVRVGMVMQLTEEEVKAIAENEPVHFNTILQEGRCHVDGNSYVPETTLCWETPNDRHFCKAMGMNDESEIGDCDINFVND